MHERRAHHLLLFYILLLLLSLSSNSQAGPRSILVISPPYAIYQSVRQQISTGLTGENLQFTWHAPSEVNATDPYDLIISIGTDAFLTAVELFPQTPLIASFLPKRVFAMHQKRHLGPTTAIFIDQAPHRQMLLVQALVPEITTLGTVFGQSSVSERAQLQHYANLEKIHLNSVVLKEEENPISTLQHIIVNSDAFLAVPDQNAFNRASAKWSIYIALKSSTPLIGFSKKYVDSGALAALYSTPEQIGQQTAEVLKHYLSAKQLPLPAHPAYYQVVTNPVTARRIGVRLPDKASLNRQLNRASAS